MAETEDVFDDAAVGRREQKKERTRRALIAVSSSLFLEQGYDATTLDQICVEVGVHTMTLLRYFPSKAHLALAPLEDVLHAFTDRLEDPERVDDAITIWRHHVRTEAVRYQEVAAGYLSWIDSEPVLRARLETLTTEHEDAMATALAADAGTEADDLTAILLASTLVRGNAAVTRRWIGRGAPPEDLVGTQLAVIDLAVATFG
ncbi:MAG: TetR/AcrR family transcriptional regulator [Actinomycetota bacterium]|nr:TetR/AcrR family transcriptional regulator [Actinomycetota bacterium]